MTFGEALEALLQGKAVKLPEWKGNWTWVNDNIQMNSKDGSVMKLTDTTQPLYTFQNMARADWEIATNTAINPVATFSFGDAIRYLKGGRKVARAGWNGKGMYLWLLPTAEVKREWVKDPMLLSVFGDRDTLSCLGSIRMLTATGEVLTGWLASQTDMLANDWTLVTN